MLLFTIFLNFVCHQSTIAQINMSDHFESEFLTLWIEDGILYGRYTKNLDMTLEIAKVCVESRIYFAKGRSYPVIVDMKGISSSTRDAREYMATIGSTLVSAAALITGSAINRALGNVFLKIDKPPIPTKLFSNDKKAKAWIMQFVKEPLTA